MWIAEFVETKTKQSGEGGAYHADRLVKATRQQHRRLSWIPRHGLHLVLMMIQRSTAKKRKKAKLTTTGKQQREPRAYSSSLLLWEKGFSKVKNRGQHMNPCQVLGQYVNLLHSTSAVKWTQPGTAAFSYCSFLSL